MASRGPRAYRFGEFTLDLEAYRLTHDGRAIPLQPKVFQTLCCLIERSGRLVTKHELHDHVWGNVAVSDGAIVRCIAALRKAIGDAAPESRFVETVARVGYRFIGDVEAVAPASEQAAVARPGRALVVLPFVDLNPESGREYFADGFTDLLIADLGRIAALHVISRTSAMCYRDTAKPLPQIARELQVDTAIEGSILYAGTRLRITVQLIDAPADRHLWAHSYEKDLHDVLQLQREVARDITGAIHLALSADETRRLSGGRVVDPEAHEAYLKGCYFWHKRRPADVQKSVGWFERAIGQDPLYAPPHAGLAQASGVAGFFGYQPPAQAFGQMKAHASAALALDPHLADAHACLAAVHLFHEWDWKAAEDRFAKALEENPNHPIAREWHGWCLVAAGRLEEALAEIRRARELDPLSARAQAAVAMSLYFARRHEHAIDCLQAAVELDPHFADAYCGLGLNWQRIGAADRAFAAFERALALSGRSVEDIASSGFAYGAAGRHDEARAFLAELDALTPHRYVPPIYFAAIHAGLGDESAACDWLERALAERSSWLVFARVEPWWDGLRGNARFEDLLRQIFN